MVGWVSIILAGGESRRMGYTKALLKVEGRTFLERLIRVVHPFSDHVIVVGKEANRGDLKTCLPSVPDLELIGDDPRFIGKGPLAGMHAGMVRRSADYYFVCACDMPCLDESYLLNLKIYVENNRGYEAYIPIDKGKFQPFAAVYTRMYQQIEGLLSQDEHKWFALLSRLQHYHVIDETTWGRWTECPNPFFNVNTPEDYRRIRSGCV